MVEIILNFFTSYDKEAKEISDSSESIFSLRLIAWRYVLSGQLILHVLAAFPFYYLVEDGNDSLIRDLLLFKLLIISRMTIALFESSLKSIFKSLQSEDTSTDERIA